jgi:hypothetical protein
MANPYSVHPGVKMMQDWVATLKTKTGRDLSEWLAFIRKDGPRDEKAARAWLKEEIKLGTNTAWWLAERAHNVKARGWDDDPKAYLAQALQFVKAQYAGKKAHLLPIYEALLTLGKAQGKDVKVCPCQTMVPLYRKHVFAQIKPTTQTRIDLGFCLRGVKPTKRLLTTGGEKKGDRITHRIEISSLKDIDADVKKWLKHAYNADA